MFGHNLETVPRLFKHIPPGFGYDRSLHVLDTAHCSGLITKSNLILGFGESRAEVTNTLHPHRRL